MTESTLGELINKLEADGARVLSHIRVL
jgi:hypothetical protein